MKTLKWAFILILMTGLFVPSYGQRVIKLDKKHHTLTDSVRRKLFGQDPKELKWKQDHFFNLLQTPDTVTKLKFDRIEFDHWPDISRLNRIVELRSSGNKYQRISGAVSISPYLKSITLTNDDIRHIRFQPNDSVETLILSENELRRIPHSIKKLTHLRTLYLNHNKIKRIPHWMVKLRGLKELEINYNRLKVNKNTFKRLQHLKLLQIGANHLTRIPENIFLLKNLRNLNLGKNELSSVPSSFAKLDSLRILIFYHNKFTSIPPEVFHLHYLEELDFYYNSLDSLPPALGSLTHLKHLYFAFNHLHAIPDTLRNLKNLTHLYLHHNEITQIPSWITSLKKLQVLGIGYNQLKTIPDFSVMPALYELDFQHNQITHFPWKLLGKTNLRLLLTQHNPCGFTKPDYQKLKSEVAQLAKKGIVVIY